MRGHLAFDSGADLFGGALWTFSAVFPQGQNQLAVCVTIPNYFKSPYRGICIWTFCYWHFCKRRASGHGAPNTVLPDGVQTKLHQYRLPSTPPVHKQWEHLYRRPGCDTKGSEILSLQTRRSEHLLRLIYHGEYVSPAVSPKFRFGWRASHPLLLILSSLSQWF